jgi:leucyl-tRNA synthetase
MDGIYDPHEVESRWQSAWEEARLYHTDLDGARRPFYNLMEFPYPSGEGLHVGHFYSYSGADTFGRFQRMRGYDVFQPMGFDAFGIHAENYALKMGLNPAELVPRNVRRFREEQLKRMGAAFDWSREVNTTDPRYYRWTQWIFLQLLRGGLAYRGEAAVNWCPSCLTTLADEQVVLGRCERCDAPVARRTLTQWFFRITAYAERLLDFTGADFSETTCSLQQHWIGRKEGAEIDFPIAGGAEHIKVFSTRADTLYGATFLVLAPEHPAVMRVTTGDQRGAVDAYLQQVAQHSEAERQAAEHAKTGVWTGSHAVNPVDGRLLPVWVADYVLSSFGTGAIFATPAHDQRDLDFARPHGLPVIPVVRPAGCGGDDPQPGEGAGGGSRAYEGDGVLVNSGPYNGLSVDQARRAIVTELGARGLARPAVTYRLRNWLISRQRYWGPPIPVIYCDHCGQLPAPEDSLPILLPHTEHFRPLGTGLSPLAAVPEFVPTSCPSCGKAARRETDVSDNFLDSAWYFLRYLSTECDDRPWDAERLRRWLPVHMYIGGVEHSTMHHLYARFLWKALVDLGHSPSELGTEPFARLRLHGLIIKDGSRMSKSRGNIVNPDAYVARYGADVLRVHMLFLGPFEVGGDFRDSGINGIVRFLNRVWRLATGDDIPQPEGADPAPLLRVMHQTIRKVTGDLESLAFNTAISALMSYVNALQDQHPTAPPVAWAEAVRSLLLMLAPFAPHLSEELWARRGWPFSVHQQPWPAWDPQLAAEDLVTLVVQVDGKVRDRIQVPTGIGQAQAQELALASAAARRALSDRPVRQVVYVPGRLVNLVTG